MFPLLQKSYLFLKIIYCERCFQREIYYEIMVEDICLGTSKSYQKMDDT